ncbi:MAG: hypothetical protein ACFB4J_17335 [Elainellaceae cyanobacterium]
MIPPIPVLAMAIAQSLVVGRGSRWTGPWHCRALGWAAYGGVTGVA